MPLFEMLAAFFVAILLGGMIFFPSVVAPTVFKSLDQDSAGQFLRRLFPAYYVFIIVTSLLGGGFLLSKPILAIALFSIAASTLLVRQVLVPKINAWRDRELAGDEAAAARFNAGHRASVIINLAQLAATVWVFWRLVAATE
ncbi:MAG: DUF4149 domain-containing protein [Pseudomonadota bacterium]